MKIEYCNPEKTSFRLNVTDDPMYGVITGTLKDDDDGAVVELWATRGPDEANTVRVMATLFMLATAWNSRYATVDVCSHFPDGTWLTAFGIRLRFRRPVDDVRQCELPHIVKSLPSGPR